MGDGAWIVSSLTKEPIAFDTEEAANRAAIGMRPALTVVWWCVGIEPTPNAHETHRTAPVAAEGVVERVLGHLGLRMELGS